MPSLPAYTIGTFGITALLVGARTLLIPRASLQAFQLPQSALPVLKGNALAALAMGIYYPLAAYQENMGFFKATVPMRCLSSAVFWSCGGWWKVVGVWEGIGAVSTGLAIWWVGGW